MTPTSAIAVEAPAHLSEASRALWTRILEENSIDAAAMPILLTYCEARDRREDARTEIKRLGAVFLDRFGGQKISPHVAIERDSTLIMHRAFRLLGFDQEARGGGNQGELFK